MSEPHSFSDELLNAFIDNELVEEDKARIYRAMQTDPALAERVAALRSVSDLVKIAYGSVGVQMNAPKPTRRTGPWAVAAVLLLGFALGWFGYARLHPQPESVRLAALQDPAQKQTLQKVVFHITQADATAFEQVLDEAEHLLNGTATGLGPMQAVKVIANGPGMLLLTEDAAPQIRSRVMHMAAKYANLTFIGCLETRKLMAKNGVKLGRMLAGVTMVASGTSEALLMQKQGWAYLSI